MHYAELHCRTNFSFLSGASHPQELVAYAAKLGLSALAITDLSGLYGIVRAWEARRKLAVATEGTEPTLPRLLFGSELELDPIPDERNARQPSDALVVIARHRAGYARLSALISRGRRRVAKGEFSLAQAEVRRIGGEHLLVLAGGPRSRLLREGKAARHELSALREAFGDALTLELTRHRRPGDFERSRALYALGRELNVPAVATNDVFFHVPHRKKLADVLHCIRETMPLAEAGRRLLPNAERHLKGAAAMQALFSDLPEAVAFSAEVASRCDFDLSQLHYSYPQEARGLVRRVGRRRPEAPGAARAGRSAGSNACT
ncbi:MAG: PHP domain-containing protein [Deltaproteobacteria bacterium]|nr:PHP domain-containing protein [Deltaproteobacteria bacterium]